MTLVKNTMATWLPDVKYKNLSDGKVRLIRALQEKFQAQPLMFEGKVIEYKYDGYAKLDAKLKEAWDAIFGVPVGSKRPAEAGTTAAKGQNEKEKKPKNQKEKKPHREFGHGADIRCDCTQRSISCVPPSNPCVSPSSPTLCVATILSCLSLVPKSRAIHSLYPRVPPSRRLWPPAWATAMAVAKATLATCIGAGDMGDVGSSGVGMGAGGGWQRRGHRHHRRV